MRPIKKILVPTDFSNDANNACSLAQNLAEMYGAKVDLLHVIPLIQYFNESIQRLGIPLDMEKDVYPRVRKESEQQLQNQMDDYLHDNNKGHFIVNIDRKPSKNIIEEANASGYDLIVLGAKGSHETEMFKGSITEKVIRLSNVPVFVATDSASLDNIKRIMVPTDVSEISLLSLPIAAQMARYFDAEIVLFHVLELYGTLSENIPREFGTTEEVTIYHRLLEEIKKLIPDIFREEVEIVSGNEPFSDYLVVKQKNNVDRIHLKTVIKKGVNAHYEIENYAPDNADLLVMSTHGHSGLAHFFLGSTTEKVAQHVDIPTLTIRPQKKHLKAK